MQKYIVLKLIGLAMLVMITLIVISILEVAVYSYLVNPGHEISVYEAHAEFSAPYVSGIFGFILFFLVARHWKKKEYHNLSKLIFLFHSLMYCWTYWFYYCQGQLNGQNGQVLF
ncbi:MAG: hypothetical protein IPN33_26610 [Saprospiraceae bacterium]|nr:hypothetical protein [Saprospiraceae bacterium]